jgi:serine/threonine protein kinase
MSDKRHHNALPSGYKLHWYVIGSVLGQGGFGITYVAVDTNLDQRVAIKEFLPAELVTRSQNSHVHPMSAEHNDTYGWGLNRFVTEAQTLAKFRHPNIVRVMSVFEANNTAYMVMEYEQGESLEAALRESGIASEDRLREIIMPLLDGLAIVHAEGFIHRDIKPDNIYLRSDGTPVLLDFGSARQALGVATRTLTALVTPGYAPFEQYDTSRAGEKKQGPWTDIYALGATLYRGISGRGPSDAMARVNAVVGGSDVLKPAAQAARGKFSPAFLDAIDWALQFLPENRPQTIAEWRAALAGEMTPPKPKTAHSATTQVNPHAPTEIIDPGNLGGTPTEAADQEPASTSATMVASGRIAPPTPRKPTPGAVPEQDGAGRRARIAGVLAVIAVVGALGAWYVLTPPPARVQQPAPVANAGSQEELAREAAREKQREQQAAKEAREHEKRDDDANLQAALAKERAATEAARRQVEIEKLLRKAATAVAADRLTTPSDDNAFTHYNNVLAMDPGNSDATHGLKSVLHRYLVLAKAAWTDRDFDLAERHLDKAAAVSPGAESVTAARATLKARIEADRQETIRAEAEARRVEAEARRAEEERRRMEAARLAAEEERQRMEAARLAAEEERRRMERERLAELERLRLAEEAAVLAKMEEEFQTAQKIAGLLAAADEDIAAKRFTEPGESNAVDRYRAVLELDAGNGDAKAGLRAIADRQVEGAYDDIDAYEFDKAAASLELARQIDADAETILPAEKKLAAAVAAYDGTKPLLKPPYRFTFMPVAGNHTCTGGDPKPEIERFGRSFLQTDLDVDYVPVTSNDAESWIRSGVSKEPHRRRLFPLGRQLKLDGALMYWFSAIGVQCLTVHVDVYLVDMQVKEVYHTRGSSPDMKKMTDLLLYQFKKGREKRAKGR